MLFLPLSFLFLPFPFPFLSFTFSFSSIYYITATIEKCHWQNNYILQYQFCFSGVATSNAKSSKIQNKFVQNQLSSSFHHSLIIIIIMRGNISYLHLMKSTQLYCICVCIYIYIYIYIYMQCLAKVFIPHHLFPILLCFCLMLNHFKLLFFPHKSTLHTPYWQSKNRIVTTL